MRRVVVESPYSGYVYRNVAYARKAVLDCLERGEAPIASHLLFPDILDDSVLVERLTGIAAGHAWIDVADAVVVYADHGVSAGMAAGIECGVLAGKPVEYRYIEKESGAAR